MCGRTACTLSPGDVQKALCYKPPGSSRFVKPRWRDVSNGGRCYKPSHNVCPTDITPVLLSGEHYSEPERIVQPMMWGMIPPWHKGDYKSHNLSTNNCRIENLTHSKLYKGPYLKGQRCVVVCDGFYEWQTTKGKGAKQPYFIYMPQCNDIRVEDDTTWECHFSDVDGWHGPKLLHMAAIFDSWKSPEGDEIFSYSVITLESNETLSWLHHRMPAILDSEELISSWLDFGQVNGSNALQMLHGIKCLSWHPVSTLVNNSRNKDVTCNKPINMEKKASPRSKSADLMESWLKKGAPKRTSVEKEPEEQLNKIPKVEL